MDSGQRREFQCHGYLTIQNNQGQLVFAKGSGTLGGAFRFNNTLMSVMDSDQTVTVTTNTSGTRFILVARCDAAAQNYYQCRIDQGSSGNLLSFYRVAGGTNTLIQSFSVGAININTTYCVRFQVMTSGGTTNLNAKVWAGLGNGADNLEQRGL